jgi:hypothetical protein
LHDLVLKWVTSTALHQKSCYIQNIFTKGSITINAEAKDNFDVTVKIDQDEDEQ